MAALFLKALNMSIAAGWLIAVVIVLRLVLKRAPKWIMPVLWGIVGIRLVLPVSLQSRFSLIPSAEVLPQTIISGYTFRLDTGFTGMDVLTNNYLGASYFEGVTVPAGYGNSLMTTLGFVWAAGMCVFLIYSLARYFRWKKDISESIPLKDNIRLCDHVRSPFILGIRRPVIYLPSGISEADADYVLAHEQAHLKRRDHLWKLLGYLCLCVYWFNPLVWTAYILMCRDIELACDEKAIAGLDMREKKAYAAALLNCSMQRRIVAAYPAAFGEVGVKERVKSVLNYKKPAFWTVITAAAVCVMVSVCFLTNPEQKNFDIRITIPAGAEEAFYYSDEEISPRRSMVTLLSVSGTGGDTSVVLVPADAAITGKNISGGTYMTPGMPVRIDAEKESWYKIGIRASNPDEEDGFVCIQARDVEVRIASAAGL